jgi:2-polyprenyl-3-methyl-5-hydroxy-6-metoxy-1,4-benzoquinol methylase
MDLEHEIQWDDAKLARLWNYYSRSSSFSESYFSKVFGGRLLLKSGLPLREPLQVLDVGCGPGEMWEHLVRLGSRWSYTGMDSSSESVDRLRSRAQGHAQFKAALHVTAYPSPVAEGSMDVVLLIEVVEHLADGALDAVLSEVVRVLKPGGLLLVSTPNEENLPAGMRFCPECGAIFHQWQHVRSWSADSLAARMGRSGLRGATSRALDLSDQGLVRPLLRRMKRWITGFPKRPPHLVATFRKSSF